MEQISHLIIQVSSSQVDTAKKRLGELGFAAEKTESSVGGVKRASDGLMGGMLRLLGPLVSVGVAMGALSKLVNVARQFEVLEAQLRTATGSAENATIAFDAIKDFAATTPYDLAQATKAFIGLVNRGLDPSEKALRSYGNTASAMGLQLDQMVNAVAKATTGEFEPLKAFGVGAKKEADGIEFTFRGLATKVGNNTKEIEEYFIKLGEANFGDAMQLRMETLDGAISNLGDAWNQMFATISKQGAGGFMTTVVKKATEAIEELTVIISSGAIEGYIQAIGTRFETTFADIKESIDTVSGIVNGAFEIMGIKGGDAANFIKEAFLNLPHYVTSGVKVIGATLGLLTVYAEAVGKMMYEKLVARVEYAGSTINNIITELMDKLNNPLGDGVFDYTKEQAASFEKFSSTISKSWDDVKQTIDDASTSYVGYVVDLGDAHDKEISKSNEAIDAVKQQILERRLYLEQERDIAAQEAAFGRDRLSRFKTGDVQTVGPTDEQKKQFASLQESLMGEEAAVDASYKRRIDLIRINTIGNADLEKSLTDSLNERKLTEMDSAQQAYMTRLDNQYHAEQTALQTQLDNRLISEADFHIKSKAAWNNYTSALSSISSEGARRVSVMQLNMHAQVLTMAGNISAQLEGLAGQNTAAAKAMFIASKAIAIAQAIVYTELAATRAVAEGGIYFGIPMASIVRGMGYASVGLMAATSVMEYGGKFEHGGMIPAGKSGLVGETGMPELVRGPAMVSSARTTAAMGSGSGGGGVSVTVNNFAGVEVETKEQDDSQGKMIEITIRKAQQRVANDIRTGNGPVSSAMESSYGTRRGAAA